MNCTLGTSELLGEEGLQFLQGLSVVSLTRNIFRTEFVDFLRETDDGWPSSTLMAPLPPRVPRFTYGALALQRSGSVHCEHK